jgi:molecular chaperone GrpE
MAKNSIKDKKVSKKNSNSEKINLDNQIKDLEDKYLRLKAEFDNFRKRKEQEVSSLLKYEGKNLIKEFVSIFDNLSRGINSYNDESIKSALILIRDEFLRKLELNEVTSFGQIGDQFDPNLHEALTVTNEKSKSDDEIVEIFECGFKYKDLIIRHAKVVVNKK